MNLGYKVSHINISESIKKKEKKSSLPHPTLESNKYANMTLNHTCNRSPSLPCNEHGYLILLPQWVSPFYGFIWMTHCLACWILHAILPAVLLKRYKKRKHRRGTGKKKEDWHLCKYECSFTHRYTKGTKDKQTDTETLNYHPATKAILNPRRLLSRDLVLYIGRCSKILMAHTSSPCL